jgi:hypothetical protein
MELLRESDQLTRQVCPEGLASSHGVSKLRHRECVREGVLNNLVQRVRRRPQLRGGPTSAVAQLRGRRGGAAGALCRGFYRNHN